MATLLAPKLETLGFSRENRPVGIYWYGDPKPTLDTLLVGAFHGDEEISAQLLFRLINAFENYPDQYQRVLKPAKKTDPVKNFAILPVLNPDGLVIAQRMNAAKVDLNRNYPTKDWQEENQDTTYYSGPAAGSEPETQIMMGLIKTYKPRKIISVHAPYKVINYDGPALKLAKAMSEKCGYPVVDDIGYATPGSFGTYAGKERKISVITLELPEDEPLDDVWHATHDALIESILY